MEKLILFILLMNFFFCSANTTAKEDHVEPKNELEMIEKPFYRISMNASACFFDIQVNHVSLLSMDVHGQMPMDAPLNYLIIESGLQELSIRILPNLGETSISEDAMFSCTLQLLDVQNGFKHVEDVAYYDLTENSIKTALPEIEAQITFQADVPYKLTAWQNSVDLKTIPNIRELLAAFYKKTEALISSKQYEEFVALMSEREKNMAMSLYLSESASKRRMDDLVKDFEDGFRMEPFSDDDILIYCAKNKALKIVKKDMESAIRFFNEKTGEEITLDILLHLKKGETELSVI